MINTARRLSEDTNCYYPLLPYPFMASNSRGGLTYVAQISQRLTLFMSEKFSCAQGVHIWTRKMIQATVSHAKVMVI